MHDQRLLSLVLLFAVGACSAERGSEAGTWLAEPGGRGGVYQSRA
jgi:hypothetical protein